MAGSGFDPGKSYVTVRMDKIQDRLLLLSQELVQSIPTRHTQLNEVLVPVSMALLNKYDNEYLGIVGGRVSAVTCRPLWSVAPRRSAMLDANELKMADCGSCASASSCNQAGTGECPSQVRERGEGLMSELTPEQEAMKQAIWDRMSPRRKKFVERMGGYETWDPLSGTQRPHRHPQGPHKAYRDPAHARVPGLPAQGQEVLAEAFHRGAQEIAFGLMDRAGPLRKACTSSALGIIN